MSYARENATVEASLWKLPTFSVSFHLVAMLCGYDAVTLGNPLLLPVSSPQGYALIIPTQRWKLILGRALSLYILLSLYGVTLLEKAT